MSFVLDASAALAMAFDDERTKSVTAMEDRLADGEETFTAPIFHQEVLEGLLLGTPPLKAC